MKTTRAKKAAARVPRRWRTPPPLTRGSEALEGMGLLREIGGETGVLLWQAYRNVMFWGSAEEGERAVLFSPKAGEKRRRELAEASVPRGLLEPLNVIAELLDSPDDIPGDRVAEACTEIAHWATEERHAVTALSFAQAAALAAPRSAALSYSVGQLARNRGEAARAESWFRHTIMIGRQVGDWDSYSRAYLSLGNMLVLRGNFPAAQRMHIKALRAARRKGLHHLQGNALHDLFVIAAETGPCSAGGRPRAPGLPRVRAGRATSCPVLAIGRGVLLDGAGLLRAAGEVFQALEPHIWEPRTRVNTLANLARAAAGSGSAMCFVSRGRR
jgi:tetratricopeptide (TPR) repeat protein